MSCIDNLPVIILGAGGHAKVVLAGFLLNGITVLGLTDPDENKKGKKILGVPVLGDDEILENYPSDMVVLANGIGSIRDEKARMFLYYRYRKRGYNFINMVHPQAIIDQDNLLGQGCQIMAGAVVQTGSWVGENVIINTRASIDHDCRIGNHSHVAPGVTLCGGVTVEEGVHIGTGATVVQGISLGKNSIIGAGAVVLKNVPNNVIVIGVPARVMEMEK